MSRTIRCVPAGVGLGPRSVVAPVERKCASYSADGYARAEHLHTVVTCFLACARSATEDSLKSLQHSQLRQDHRAGGIAVEGFDLAVCQLKHVTTWGVHLFSRRRNDADGQLQRPLVRALQREFDDDGVTDDVERVQLPMHVGKRCRINLDGATEFLRAAIGDTDGFIGERAVLGETVHPPADVFVLSYLIGLPNCCLVSGHMTVLPKKQTCWSKTFEADGDGPMRRPPLRAGAEVASPERREQRTRS